MADHRGRLPDGDSWVGPPREIDLDDPATRATLDEAVAAFLEAEVRVALTGAGISVESGIPDFRSPGGLWTVFSPDEYATIDVFMSNPEKAWRLFRAIGRTLQGAHPNAAHTALARLELAGLLDGVVTQNVDRLHQAAGSRQVLEVHGHHDNLHCLECDATTPLDVCCYEEGQPVPRCPSCGGPLKPTVVLFGEAIRDAERIEELLLRCRALLVIGTSAQVYPANEFPAVVKMRGGVVIEFNLEPTALTRDELAFHGTGSVTDYFVRGAASVTLAAFAGRVIERAVRGR
ncbi:MAG: NAD-dependent deacylase [Planctomycetota bacterium]